MQKIWFLPPCRRRYLLPRERPRNSCKSQELRGASSNRIVTPMNDRIACGSMVRLYAFAQNICTLCKYFVQKIWFLPPCRRRYLLPRERPRNLCKLWNMKCGSHSCRTKRIGMECGSHAAAQNAGMSGVCFAHSSVWYPRACPQIATYQGSRGRQPQREQGAPGSPTHNLRCARDLLLR